MKIKASAILSLLSLAASGCGDKTQTGMLIDAPVQGVSYETATGAGVTDAEGAFFYRPDEAVRFFLGDITLGETVGEAVVNPFDLVPGAALLTESRSIRAALHDLLNREPHPFGRVVNLTLFLQSLDRDQNPSNGIAIPEGMADLAAGATVDFDDRGFRFQRDPGLTRLVRDGAAAGLFTAGPFERGYGEALDHLYGTLGVMPEISRASVRRSDDDGDGIFERTTRIFYDAAGLEEGTETDTDGDGAADRVFRRTFNERGQVVRSETDEGNDGTVDQTDDFSYDGFGRLVLIVSDDDNDGAADSREEREYDASGNLIRTVRDDDGDGATDRVETYAFDEKNRNVARTVDVDGDGVVDASFATFFDADGNLVRGENDNDNDGAANSVSTSTFDANGRNVRFDNDLGVDGTIDSSSLSSYDDDGRLVRSEFDADGDGAPESVTTYAYDDLGNLVSAAEDTDGDGATDRVTTVEINASGYPVRTLVDADADGTADAAFETDYEPGSWRDFFEELFD